MPGEIAKLPATLNGTHVINVSDEYIHANHYAAANNVRETVYHHWFPLNECTGHMGLNSLFGALVVLHEAETNNSPVLLHCHAGINRSQMVRAAYYFLRTGRHLEEPERNQALARQVNQTFNPPIEQPENERGELMRPNMLLINCQTSMLPPLVLVEKFLKHLSTRLEETSTMAASRGGLLTQLKLDIGLQ